MRLPFVFCNAIATETIGVTERTGPTCWST